MKLEDLQIEVPKTVNNNEPCKIRITLNESVLDWDDLNVYVVPPGEEKLDIKSTFVNVSTNVDITNIEAYEATYTFEDDLGIYQFIVVDTALGDVYQAGTHCMQWASNIMDIFSTNNSMMTTVGSIATTVGAVESTANLTYNIVSAATPVGGISLVAPAFVGRGESDILSVLAIGTGADLTNHQIYLLPPTGGAIEITDMLTDTEAPFTFFTQFNTSYVFQQQGLYILLGVNTSTGATYATDIYCASWTSRIDQPISDLDKQRSDIQRVFGRLNRG